MYKAKAIQRLLWACGLVCFNQRNPFTLFYFSHWSFILLVAIEVYWPVPMEQCCGLTAFTFLFIHVWLIPDGVWSTAPFTIVFFFSQKTVIFIQAFGSLLVPWFLDSFSIFRQGTSFALVLLIALSIVYASFTKVTCSHLFENMQLYFFTLRENHEAWTLLSL